MSAGRAAYLRQQRYAQLTAYSIQRQYDNKQYGKQKEEEKKVNKAKLKELTEACEAEFLNDSEVSSVLQEYFDRWRKYKFSRNYSWAVESIRLALADFSIDTRERLESIVKQVDATYEKEMKETKKREEHEEFKRQFMELQKQRKAAK
ncbi:MAG: hypothetical protein J6C46_12185 [Clostridia bacterium]|nr:hypothetical protein [Clostridia bacterium]